MVAGWPSVHYTGEHIVLKAQKEMYSKTYSNAFKMAHEALPIQAFLAATAVRPSEILCRFAIGSLPTSAAFLIRYLYARICIFLLSLCVF